MSLGGLVVAFILPRRMVVHLVEVPL